MHREYNPEPTCASTHDLRPTAGSNSSSCATICRCPRSGEHDDVRVRIRAAALNHLDLFVVGGLPGVTIVPPWSSAADACGIDRRGRRRRARRRASATTCVINPGHQRPHVRVLPRRRAAALPALRAARRASAGHARRVHRRARRRTCGAIPPDRPPESAAAFTLATLTAWRMLVTRARVQPGEHVLIWGIGGGVALAALQIAKQIGARVWVDVRQRREARAAPRRWAPTRRSTIDDVDVAREIRARTGKRGVDVVVDNVGKATWAQSLARARPARAAGDVRRARRVRWSRPTCAGCSGISGRMLGSTMGNDAEFDAIVGELRAGRLLPPVDSVYPLADGRAAFERLRERGAVRQDRRADRHERRTRRGTSRRRSARCGRRARAASRRHVRATGGDDRAAIGGGSFGLGYARKREWLICPTCRRSVIFDREATGREQLNSSVRTVGIDSPITL